MSQAQDPISQLTQVIIPKIITRLKDSEAKLVLFEQEIADLKEQVTLLHAGQSKKTERTSRKKKGQEAPELLPTPEQTPRQDRHPDRLLASEQSANPNPIPAPEQTPGPEVVGQYVIDGRLVQAVRYAISQGYADSPTIATALNVPENVIKYVMTFSLDQQEEIMRKFPA